MIFPYQNYNSYKYLNDNSTQFPLYDSDACDECEENTNNTNMYFYGL